MTPKKSRWHPPLAPPEGIVLVNANIRVPVAEIADLGPERAAAFMAGLGAVLAATRSAPTTSPDQEA